MNKILEQLIIWTYLLVHLCILWRLNLSGFLTCGFYFTKISSKTYLQLFKSERQVNGFSFDSKPVLVALTIYTRYSFLSLAASQSSFFMQLSRLRLKGLIIPLSGWIITWAEPTSLRVDPNHQSQCSRTRRFDPRDSYHHVTPMLKFKANLLKKF